MALTSTIDELVTAVLRKMTVIDATETPDADDVTFVTEAYNKKFYQMQDQDLAYWTRTAIPNTIFSAVRDLIVNEVREAYGDGMSAAEKESEELILLRPIRRHVNRKPSGNETQADYF